MERRIVFIGLVVALAIVMWRVADESARAFAHERTRMLQIEGNIAEGPVAVFFGNTKFGELAYQETLTEPTLIFSSEVRSPGAAFSMNVEFLREIVQIADAERAKQKGEVSR